MKYRTVKGLEIECDPTPEQAAFIERVTAEVDSIDTTAQDIHLLIHSTDNPLVTRFSEDQQLRLVQTGLFTLSEVRSRGIMTEQDRAGPIGRILFDLIYRKCIATRIFQPPPPTN